MIGGLRPITLPGVGFDGGGAVLTLAQIRRRRADIAIALAALEAEDAALALTKNAPSAKSKRTYGPATSYEPPGAEADTA